MTKPFYFKQFVLEQDLSAMKVGMDGVLLGSWADAEGASKVLDIGCGSGVIALMLAQRFREINSIHGVDIDEGAYKQSCVNFDNSPWSDRLSAFCSKVQDFEGEYDYIISNPPYFKPGSEIKGESRSLARYTNSLETKELFEHVNRLLSINGKFALIMPYLNKQELIEVASKEGLFLKRCWNVKSRLHKPFERVLLEFVKGNGSVINCEEQEIVLLQGNQRTDFTDDYIALVKDFYTIL